MILTNSALEDLLRKSAETVSASYLPGRFYREYSVPQVGSAVSSEMPAKLS